MEIGEHVGAAHCVASFYPTGVRIDGAGERLYKMTCLIEDLSKFVIVCP